MCSRLWLSKGRHSSTISHYALDFQEGQWIEYQILIKGHRFEVMYRKYFLNLAMLKRDFEVKSTDVVRVLGC